MLKKVALALAVASSFMIAAPQAAVAGPEDGCNLNCLWVPEYNDAGDIIGGGWVCSMPPVCYDWVEP